MTSHASNALAALAPAIRPGTTTDERARFGNPSWDAVCTPGSNLDEQRIAELETRIGELDAYTSSVSHDLRAPLRAVHGYACALEEDHGPEMSQGARSFLTKIVNAAQEMERVIEALLALSRTGAQAMAMSPVDMRGIVDEVLMDLGPARTDRVRLSIGRLYHCHGNPDLLQQLWTNLLSNALKFTRERDPAMIEIGSSETARTVTYFVRDNGVGFDMNHACDLFLPFRRFHDAREYEGHGIGLATARRIVSCHDGRLWADAHPGKGASFYFTLPASC